MEYGELDEVLDEDVDPVIVLVLKDVLVDKEELVVVELSLPLMLLKGQDVDVFDTVADLVEVFVLADVTEANLDRVSSYVLKGVLVYLDVLVDVLEDIEVRVGNIFLESPTPVL